jgi:hypothetical protein
MLTMMFMSEQRKVRCCASVNRPYASVMGAIHRLSLASTAAAPVHVHSICDQEHVAGLPSVTRVALDWERAEPSAPLPVTSAEIYAWAHSPAETQLEVEGHVAPASGPESDADVAGASLQALLEKLIDRLRRDIDSNTDGCATLARDRALGAA